MKHLSNQRVIQSTLLSFQKAIGVQTRRNLETSATSAKQPAGLSNDSQPTTTESHHNPNGRNRLRTQQRYSPRDLLDAVLSDSSAVEPIDIGPIIKDPVRLFPKLDWTAQSQVIDFVRQELKRDWTKVSDDVKRTAYVINFGNWGPRKDGDFDTVAPGRVASGGKSITKKTIPVVKSAKSEKSKDLYSMFIGVFIIFLSILGLSGDYRIDDQERITLMKQIKESEKKEEEEVKEELAEA